jgi:exoribonuclease R
VVVVEIVQQPSPQHEAIARVVEVLGGYTDPAWRSRSRCASTISRTSSRSPRRKQAAKLPAEVTERDFADRVDLREPALVTIDGETARDFDDAVYCERKGKGFRLVVAIADVSHYVKDGDALDKDARERGTSVYFPRRVIPMLPEALSNELCSLKPDVDRLCMVCDMNVTAEGRIAKYEFYPAVMHSRARLTYTQVWSWLSDPVDRAARIEGHCCRGSTPSTRCSRPAGRARGARRDRLRQRRDAARVRRQGQDRAHRAGRAQRRAQADRGMHARRERLHGGVPRRVTSTLRLYRVHEGPTPEKLAGAARLSRELGAGAVRRRQPRPRPITRRSVADQGQARTTRCCKRCSCARCSRRATGPTTSATSGFRTRRMRISRRPSAAIPTCSCIARSRRC